jgi:hypothetical protein
LARYFGGDAQSWLNLQQVCDLKMTAKAQLKKSSLRSSRWMTTHSGRPIHGDVGFEPTFGSCMAFQTQLIFDAEHGTRARGATDIKRKAHSFQTLTAFLHASVLSWHERCNQTQCASSFPMPKRKHQGNLTNCKGKTS